MDEALRFFKVYELWIYFVLGLGGIIYLRKFALAWRELRGAIFGLERENAQARLNQAATMLVLLTFMVVAEFVAVSFLAPMVPGAAPIPTPTVDLLATPTITLKANSESAESSSLNVASEATLPALEIDSEGCVLGEVSLTYPAAGQTLRGEVEIRGSADIPEFGFYKLEYARGQEPLWLTIQAGRETRQDQILVEKWDTTLLASGDYVLQLVVVDNTGQSRPPCRIPVRIVAP